MKKIILLWVGALTMSAAPIQFGSQGSAADPNEWTSAGPSLPIVQHPGWAAPLLGTTWVSNGITGDPSAPGYYVPVDGTIVSFYENLTLPFVPGSGSVTYRADDSAALYVNNVLVRPEAPMSGNTYSRCSDFPVGCTTETQVTVDIATYLQQGVNTLRFDVAQRKGVSFGLNYAGMVEGYVPPPNDQPETPVSDTPEPATMALIGASMLGLGLVRARRG
ncbi:MAG: PEP-CTERM sorting domain-containing protein [Bryobacterales bacterium]|nr:PEP-CTERM sorting domain-containing protein [Bryobacterales bacterium]